MKFLSTVKHAGKVYQAGDTVPSDLTEDQKAQLVEAGALEGDKKVEEIGTPNNPTRLGAGETHPQATRETLEAQVKQKETELAALKEQLNLVDEATQPKAPVEPDANDKPKKLDDMTKRELLEYGKANGVELDPALTNREMVDKLNEAKPQEYPLLTISPVIT